MVKKWYKNDNILFLLLFLFALAIRLLSLHLEPQLARDSVYYLMLADHWYEQDKFVSLYEISGKLHILPFPVFLIKTLMNFHLNAEEAGIIINLLLGSLLPLVVYVLVRKVSLPRNIAFWAALLTCASPKAVEISITPLRDGSYLFFSGLFLYSTLVSIQNRKIGSWCLTACILALATQCRHEAIEFIPLIFCYFIFIVWRKEFSCSGSLIILLLGIVCFFAFSCVIWFIMGATFSEMISFYQSYLCMKTLEWGF